MAPTVSRSSSQSKISDTFRSGTRATKPLKQSKQAVTPTVKSVQPAVAAIPDAPAKKDSKHLNANDPKLRAAKDTILATRKAPLGTKFGVYSLTAVHERDQNTINTILRDFDLTPRYGPCVGISRLDRYRRAEKMGLKPPPEVLYILETEEGLRDWNNDIFSKKSAI